MYSSPSPSLLKSKFLYFSLIVLLGSFYVNYYLSNVDYDVDYDWMTQLPPTPIFDLILWAKRQYMALPNYIFPPNTMLMSIIEIHTFHALRELIDLEIADIIKQKGGKLSVKELSEITNTNEESLSRLLRVVSAKGIFRYHGNGVYSNNRLSSVLRKDHPNTVRYLFESLKDMNKAMEHIGQTLKYPNGWDDMNVDNNKEHELVSSWKKAYGHDIWEYYNLPENKHRQEMFNRAMVSVNGLMGDGVFLDYDWKLTENSTVIDFGGGNGGFLLELLNRYKTKGAIFDLPKVTEQSRKIWNEKHKEFLDRIEFIPGSFFSEPPPQADVFVLRCILHDWSDTTSVKILKNLRSSITSKSSPSTRLVIIEHLLDEPIRDPILTQLDMSMLCFNGKERTSREFAKILNKGGWKHTKTVNCRGTFSIIEAVPHF